MTRKDIEIHIQTADVAISPQKEVKLSKFRWVTGVDTAEELERYIYGEVEVPFSVSESAIRNNGIYVTIPYTPKYKEFKIRIVRMDSNGLGAYVFNKTNGTPWFVVKSAMYGKELSNVFASTLPMISETSFYIKPELQHARIYSSDNSDFNIVRVNRQNANCLLACVPGCNYRYPLSGVGLIRWINSNNVAATGLTEILQSEFEADGVKVQKAVYNYDTKQMELKLKVLEEED